jgi:uncharacterized protein
MTIPQPLSASERRLLSVLVHVGGIVLGLLVPLAVLSVYGARDAHLRAQSVEALNFQITVFCVLVLSVLLIPVLVGVLMLIGVLVTNLVFCSMAAVAAFGGLRFRYPFTVRVLH